MVKLSNRVSYISIFVILFVLIAIFFIGRNIYFLNNNLELEAVFYMYEKSGEQYKVSYLYEHKNKTYFFSEMDDSKPKPASKKIIYCNKNNIKRCVTNKEIYIKEIIISIFLLIPILIFMIIFGLKKGKN